MNEGGFYVYLLSFYLLIYGFFKQKKKLVSFRCIFFLKKTILIKKNLIRQLKIKENSIKEQQKHK